MKDIGVDHVTVLGMPPVDFITLAHEAGCSSVSLMCDQMYNPFEFPGWSLVDDAQLRREVSLRLDATGVTFALGEGGLITPDSDVSRLNPMLDAFCDLGAARVSAVSMEPDAIREAEQVHKLAEMATSQGLQLCFEYSRMRRRRLQDVAGTLTALRPLNIGITIDAMHFFRGGETVEELLQLDPSLFTYFQICDVPLRGEGPYMDEALNRRVPPGDGELPLASLIAALPDDIIVSVEVPQVERVRSGASHLDLLRDTVAKARALWAERTG